MNMKKDKLQNREFFSTQTTSMLIRNQLLLLRRCTIVPLWASFGSLSFSAFSSATFFHMVFYIIRWDFSTAIFAFDAVHFWMCHHVILTSWSLFKFSSTNITDEWFFVCVTPDMHFYIAVISRDKIADVFLGTFEFSIYSLFVVFFLLISCLLEL